MAQLINITSEALQATIRRLLPSQQGFGEDLQASNVITPIIDLTPTAEGSEVRADLQTALSFDGVTTFFVQGSTSTVVNTTGFYRVFGNSNVNQSTTADVVAAIRLSNGLSTRNVFTHAVASNSTPTFTTIQFDFVVFIPAGGSLDAISDNTAARIDGVTRQIADINGNLVNPPGFNPQ